MQKGKTKPEDPVSFGSFELPWRNGIIMDTLENPQYRRSRNLGYMHWWRRAEELDRVGFEKAVSDTKKILEKAVAMGIQISGPLGYGQPEVNSSLIAFNGITECGHLYRNLGKPFPAPNAEGVEATTDVIADGDPWYSGAYLNTRTCGGACAGQPFVIDRKSIPEPWDRKRDGKIFCRCETDFKPYDLIVTAVLVRLKEHLNAEVVLSPNEWPKSYEDGKRFCRELFGWSKSFELEQEDVTEIN